MHSAEKIFFKSFSILRRWRSRRLCPYRISKWEMIRSFLEDRKVASVYPTSQRVINKICHSVDFRSVKNIAELGAGNGIITAALLAKCSKDTHIVAYETNSRLAASLFKSIKDTRLKVLNESAERILFYVSGNNLKFDVIISGVPFSFFSDYRANLIIQSIHSSLNPDGLAVIYQSNFPPFAATKRIGNLLEKHFKIISRGTVVLSVPPIEILVCQKESCTA